MSSMETVNYSIDNGVALIALNRPQALNAFNARLRKDLLYAIEAADSDQGVRVVIITGEGRGFSAGADLKAGLEQSESVEEQILNEYKPCLMAISNSDKLFISAVNGPCAGIGGALAMACDLMIMAEDAYLYLAFAAIGLIPDGGITWQLVNTIGYKRALQVVVESEKISADRCLAMGIANKVAPGDALLAETRSWAERLAKGAPLAQKYAKRVLKSAMAMDLAETIELEARFQKITYNSRDTKMAVEAFFNKRVPEFTGQ